MNSDDLAQTYDYWNGPAFGSVLACVPFVALTWRQVGGELGLI